MPKDGRGGAKGGGVSRYEVVDESEIKRVVDLLVDFAEEKKLAAKTVMVAMEFIIDKIKSHLELETVMVHDDGGSIH